MVRTIVLSATLAFGLATAASAVIAPPVVHTDGLIIKVAEGCGAGRWRGPDGRCHPMAKGRKCPVGYHLGAEGRRCYPN